MSDSSQLHKVAQRANRMLNVLTEQVQLQKDELHANEFYQVYAKAALAKLPLLTRANVDYAVSEMEEKGYLRKANAAEDGRITYISLTEEGRKLSEQYNENYFAGLAPYLESISEADAKVMIQTIETFYQVMCERREKFEK